MLMIKKKKYSNYTKAELIEELQIMIDNCNNMEWQIENQVKYINQNYIPIEWLEKQADKYIELGLNSVAKELRVIIDEWEKERC